MWVSFFYPFVYIMVMKIDFVIAWVNNQDQVWRNTFIDYCGKHNLQEKIVEMLGSRYGGINFLDYQLKLVNKNMPWVNKIYLLLSNKEQINESLLPPNVEIVLHRDFIPFNFLPTFNSTTIEMFLWNIKGLEEHFIYANDDMLPIRPLKPSDFFEDEKIKIGWRNDEFKLNASVYAYQCRNNCVALSKRLKVKHDPNNLLRPLHSFTPIIKSHAKDSYMLIKDLIIPHIRAFRSIYQYNQYIYPLYELWKYGTLDSELDFFYTELNEDFDLNHDIVCVNAEKRNEYVKKFLEEIKKICE